jgi:predicted RNA binding protein YcfA (HicA-like mRNA interferase family)
VKTRELIERAEREGWTFLRRGNRASHMIYRHDGYPYILSIPDHGNRDLASGTVAKLIKQIDGTWKGPNS